jgi:hypothetical protein
VDVPEVRSLGLYFCKFDENVEALRYSQAMVARVSKTLWFIEDIVALLELVV